MSSSSPLCEAPVVVTNLHRRFTGVSATIHALVPRQQRRLNVAVLDRGELGLSGTIRCADLLRHGWRPPAGYAYRVWHGHRAPDLLLGWCLRHVLRQPWKLMATTNSPRRHGWLLRGLFGRMDAIVASSDVAASFLDRCTAIVPHGVDTERFHPPADKRAAWAESGLPGKYGIGAFGRIRPSKGTDLFVAAMCEVLPRHPDFTAILTGLCKPSDEAFRQQLLARIDAAGLGRRIVFLGDLEDVEIKRWYRRISLCVAASRSEGFGLTPLEAMASGAAAVTSRVGYFERMLVPGTNGKLVDTGDLPALCAAIEELISDPDALLELGRSAREYAVAHHSIERQVDGVHAIYADLLGSPGARAPRPALPRR